MLSPDLSLHDDLYVFITLVRHCLIATVSVRPRLMISSLFHKPITRNFPQLNYEPDQD